MVNRMTISLRSYGSANARVATMSETSAATGPTSTDVFSTVFGVVDRSVTARFTDAHELDSRMATSYREDARLPQ